MTNIDDYFVDDELEEETSQTIETEDQTTETDIDDNAGEHEEEVASQEDDISIDETAVDYFNFMKQYDLLNTNEDFEFTGSPEQIEEALHQTRENNLRDAQNQIWNSLPDDFKPLLEYGLSGGTSLQNYLSTFAPINYDEVDLEDSISQKQILKEYWRQHSNHSEERMERMISNLEKSDALKESAEEALLDLKEYREEAKAQFIQRQQAANEQARLAAQQAEAKLNEELNNYTADKNRVNRLRDFMFSPIQEGQISTTEFNKVISNIEKNQAHLIQLADILADYNPNTGFSFERIKKQLKSESAKSFRELLDSKIQKNPIRSNDARQKVTDELDWDEVFK